MKTLTIRNNIDGTSTEVNAQETSEKSMGQWVAEVDEAEFSRGCSLFCHGVSDCSCEDMHGQADVDDDGREYYIKRR